MKNKSVINAPHNSAVLLPTTSYSGNRARNTLSQLAANHVSSHSAQLRSGIAVTIVTIAATRSSCHQSVPVPATSAHYLIPRCDPEVSTSVRHNQRYFPKIPVIQRIIDEQIDELLRNDCIEPSRSPHRAPIVLVRKN